MGAATTQKPFPRPPASAPDLTDEVVQRARRSQALMLLGKRGRRSTFLAGPLGEPGPAPIAKKTALGGY